MRGKTVITITSEIRDDVKDVAIAVHNNSTLIGQSKELIKQKAIEVFGDDSRNQTFEVEITLEDDHGK
jgi:predicted nucleotidyltransferase